MSGLQNLLAPFSHLLFSNRNIVIVLLCAGLFWVALDALIHRWRAARLESDLSSARSGASNAAARRYVTTPPVVEAPVESGGLPPVKGGRTYARNLGSALHKAGMSSPQIYSPPTPAGWTPNAPAQPVPQQPGMPAPYATPNVPWAAPTQPGPAPWGYPAGAGRGMPGQPPNQAPYYQPPAPPQPPAPSPPPPPMTMPQPTGAPPAPPGLYTPTPAGSPFAQPSFPAPTSGPASPAYAPPGAPGPPPVQPTYQPPPAAPAGSEPPGQDAGRRGKPKRRRFNFNVLENLEKMVQAKPAEPVPSTAGTPPSAPAASPATSPAAPPIAPATVAPIPARPAEAESLPLFGTPASTQAADTTPPAVDAEPPVDQAPPSAVEPEVEEEAVAEEPEAAAAETKAGTEQHLEPEQEPEPEPQTTPAPSPKAEPRTSMRSMLFGEEGYSPPATTRTVPEPPSPAPEATEPEPEPASSAPEPAVAEPEPETTEPSSWPSYSWTGDEASTSTTEAEGATPSSLGAEAAGVAPSAEPVAESFGSTSFDPWKSTSSFDDAGADKAAGAPAEASTESPEGPTEAEAGGSGAAGTIVIIEDDQTAASYYATLFRGNGYRVEVANDGVSGVDLCARLQPQVILLDVMMPRQNGILVLQTLRASDETKNTPVVVMSNFSEPTLIKRAIQLGALEYVIKTQVEGPALLNALPRWMNREKAFAAA